LLLQINFIAKVLGPEAVNRHALNMPSKNRKSLHLFKVSENRKENASPAHENFIILMYKIYNPVQEMTIIGESQNIDAKEGRIVANII
jgi:hypothetical protein